MLKKAMSLFVALVMSITFISPIKARAYAGNEYMLSRSDANYILAMYLNIADISTQLGLEAVKQAVGPAGSTAINGVLMVLPGSDPGEILIDEAAQYAISLIPVYGKPLSLMYGTVKMSIIAYVELGDALGQAAAAKNGLIRSSIALAADCEANALKGMNLCFQMGMRDYGEGITRSESYIGALNASNDQRNIVSLLRSNANNGIFFFDRSASNKIKSLADKLEAVLNATLSGDKAYRMGYEVAQALASSETTESEEGTLPQISVKNGPSGVLTQGQPFYFRGSISSHTSITRATVSILNIDGAVVQTKTVYPNKGSVDFLSGGLDDLKFGSLGSGSYTFTLAATNNSGTTTWRSPFTIEAQISQPTQPTSPSINITSEPRGTLIKGNAFYFRGSIVSNSPIVAATTSILDSSGVVVQTKTVYPNKIKVDILADGLDELKFGTLDSGSYTLTLWVKDSAGQTADWSSAFSIAGSSDPVIQPSTAPREVHPKGQPFYFRGSITSGNPITTATVSIVNTSGVTVQSRTVYPNKTKVDILVDGLDELKFGTLDSGSYTLTLWVKDSAGQTADWSSAFSITGGSGPVVQATTAPKGVLPKGQPFYFRGSITSGNPITTAAVSIVNASGVAVQSRTVYPNKAKVDILADGLDELKFGNLNSGSYTLTLWVKDSAGQTADWSSAFSIQ